MKRLFYFFIAVVLMLVTACKKTTYITLETEEIWFGMEGGDTTIIVKSDGELKVNYSPHWVKAEVKNDSMLVIKTDFNNTGVLLTDKIMLKSGNVTAILNVKQTSKGSYIIPAKKMIEFEKNGGTQEVKIYTDASAIDVKALVVREIDLKKGNSGPVVKSNDCIEADYKNGILKVSIPMNGNIARLGKIWLSCNGVLETLYVAQKGSGHCSLCGGLGMVKCLECNGTGFIVTNKKGVERKDGCSACGGYGYEEKSELTSSSVNYKIGCGYVDCPEGVTGL